MAPDESAGRLLAMLQPLRLLESNWSVDIAGELTGYCEELSSLDFEVDGITGLDFTDAAFVVYHSSCTYSKNCLLYTSPSPRDRQKSRMPSSA